jgi:flagellar biosynthesis GTPase FlhF
MRAVFISYRREDVEGHAGRLFQDLAAQFGKDAVFMDVAAIEPGRDFRRIIDQQVASCGVLLAMIGKGWLDAKNEKGLRRLDDPADFVRLETASALKRDIPVVPVLVHGGRMPRAEDLPDDLKDLAYRNGVELTHARWESDVQLLVKALRPYVGGAGQEPGSANPTPPAEATAVKLETGGKTPVPGANELRGVVATMTTEPAKKSWLAILVTFAVVIAVGVGGYLSYERFAAENAEAERLRSEVATAKSAVAAAKTAAEKAAADKADAERAAAEGATAKKGAADNAAAEKAAAEKAAAERAAAKKVAAEQAAAKKAAAERALAESQVKISLVVGTNVDWAKPFLERQGLTVKLVGGSYGKVTQQTPGFGASVPQGSTVELTIRP